MAKNTKKVAYKEPDDYFPKEIRKKYKLGEFAESTSDTKKKSSTPAKKTVKRK